MVWHPVDDDKQAPSEIIAQEREEVVEAISSILEEDTPEIFSEEILEDSESETSTSGFDTEEPQIRAGGSAESLFGKW